MQEFFKSPNSGRERERGIEVDSIENQKQRLYIQQSTLLGFTFCVS